MGIYNLGGGGGAPELQAKEATPLITNAQQIILPDEGYDGLSKVTVNPMPTGALKTPTVNSIGYVSSGVQTAGYLDTSATSGLQLSTQEAKTITPTTYSQTAVASGKYTTGAVTVAGDANLVSSNIRAGKSIYGVNGVLGPFVLENSTVVCTDQTKLEFPVNFPTDATGIYGINFGSSETSGFRSFNFGGSSLDIPSYGGSNLILYGQVLIGSQAYCAYISVEISRYTTGKITCSQVTALNAPSYDKSFVTGHSYNLNVCFYVP